MAAVHANSSITISRGDRESSGMQDDTDLNLTTSNIHSEQTALIYTQAPVALGTALLVALLIAAGLWKVAPHPQLLVWLGLQLVQTMLRSLLIHLYRRAGPASRRDSQRWAQRYLSGALVSGVIWGCLGLFIDFSWPIEYQMLVLMGLAGILAGAISSYAVLMSVYIAFLFPAIIIPTQSLLTQSDQTADAMGLMLVLFSGALVMIAYNHNRNVFASLMLRNENSGLVRQMSIANVALEKEIRERKQAEYELGRDRKLFTNGPVTVFRWRAENGWPIEYVSKTVSQYGYNDGDLAAGKTLFANMIVATDLPRVRQSKSGGEDGGYIPVGIDYRIVRSDGDPRWVYDYTIPVRNDYGQITHYAGYLLDITERKQTEFELQREKDRAQITLHSIMDAVITIDVNGQVEYLNPAAERLTGWDGDVANGLPLNRVFSLFDDESRSSIDEPVMRALQVGTTYSSTRDYHLVRNDGSRLAVQFSTAPILGAGDAPLGVVLVFHDVTENRSMARQLTYQAAHDPLTGLINRAEFEIRLQYALDSAHTEQAHHALCFLDIDQFKLINDTCSHTAGDIVLQEISDLLQDCLRDSDVLGRLGGDEFGMLLRNCTLEGAVEIAGNMLSLIRDSRFESCGRTFEVGSSIGIAMIDAGTGSVSEIMQAADLACYAAKDSGRGGIHVFQAGDTDLARRHDEMQWVSRLKDAIAENRLVLYCQDIVPVDPSATDVRRHFEVLVRMRDDQGKLVMPDRFLPAAENYNMISAVDRWVVEHSLAWYAARGERLLMSVNLSGKSITDPAFLQYLHERLAAYRIPGEDICFEITETAAVANMETAAGFMHDLRRLGCRFALDDFGSGLSSFAYLRNLPVNYLKIDGSLVRNIDTDPVNSAMVNAINQLAIAMDIETIAEFVDNAAILDKLNLIGVDYAQGYGIHRPQPLTELPATTPHAGTGHRSAVSD